MTGRRPPRQSELAGELKKVKERGAAFYRSDELDIVGVAAPESSDIGIAEWIEAVVTAIDGTDGDVVLVGHSGGGNVAWAATEARQLRSASCSSFSASSSKVASLARGRGRGRGRG